MSNNIAGEAFQTSFLGFPGASWALLVPPGASGTSWALLGPSWAFLGLPRGMYRAPESKGPCRGSRYVKHFSRHFKATLAQAVKSTAANVTMHLKIRVNIKTTSNGDGTRQCKLSPTTRSAMMSPRNCNTQAMYDTMAGSCFVVIVRHIL
jgi:hypothetical protein